MADAIAVFPPGFRVTDEAGAPISGAKIKFYDAGTTTPRTVYSNPDLLVGNSLGSTVYCGSDGFPVASSGSSTEVSVYIGTAAYKVVITDASDVALITLDNRSGAIDTSNFLTSGSTSTLDIPVVSTAISLTLAASHRGKLVEANSSGGNITLTLTAAATLGDGWNVAIRASGTSGQVILSSAEAVAFEGGSFTARAFEIGESATIRCNGVGFKIENHTPPLMSSRGPATITIADRVTSAPVSPTPGARYIVATGFSTYSTGDIIESNGSSFNKYTPATNCGWIAYVQDEAALYQFQSSAWVPLSATQTQMEAASTLGVFVAPGSLIYSPNVAKGWIKCDYSGGITTSSGVSSITDTGSGRIKVTWTTAFSNFNYVVVATALHSAPRIQTVEAVATTNFDLLTADAATPTTGDATHAYAAAFGDL